MASTPTTHPAPQKDHSKPSTRLNEEALDELTPPDEQFWQRYSPHGEAPLSGLGSLILHGGAIGLLVLCAYYLASFLGGENREVPVEPVRLSLATQGGGGGKPTGIGDGPGIGKEMAAVQGEPNQEKGLPDKPSPTLPELPATQEPTVFKRFVSKNADTTANVQALNRLKDAALAKLPRVGVVPGKGEGGPGSGGGSGTGTGTGTGAGTGPGGGGKLSQRERRMLRWTMRFSTRNGRDYVGQLRGLGATLAIPTAENPNDYQYKVVRDLTPGRAKLLDEDVSKIQQIFWVDNKPSSVMQVMSTLGLRLRPSHFVAFMPVKLEQELFRLESEYLRRHHPGAKEEQIQETIFRVVRTRSGYQPQLLSVTLR